MANMSYCRFQNTLSDLRDCAENFDDFEDSCSVDELRARVRLYQTCQDIVNNYDLDDLKEAVRAKTEG